jgi:hypothetical protein
MGSMGVAPQPSSRCLRAIFFRLSSLEKVYIPACKTIVSLKSIACNLTAAFIRRGVIGGSALCFYSILHTTFLQPLNPPTVPVCFGLRLSIVLGRNERHALHHSIPHVPSYFDFELGVFLVVTILYVTHGNIGAEGGRRNTGSDDP